MEIKRHKNIPASYLILIQNKKVLLSRRYKTGYEDGKYSLTAGHVDRGETFTQAMIREAKEEIGVELRHDDLQVSHVMHRYSGPDELGERVDVFFVANRWSGEIENRELHKCDDLRWFEIDDLPENTLDYIRQALRYVDKGVFYSEYGWSGIIHDNKNI